MTDSPAGGYEACPFCGGDLLPGQRINEDHVFGRAMGGRAVVKAHETCNSKSGAGAEGDLQRPNTLMNVIKAVKGLRASSVKATLPSGLQILLDFTDGAVKSPQPRVDKADDGTTIRIEGTAAQVEKAYNKWRHRHPEANAPSFKDLPSECIRPTTYHTANVDLIHSLGAADAVAIKTALGAGVLAYGSAFARSEFAAALRALRDRPWRPDGVRQNPGFLHILDAQIEASATAAGLSTAEIGHLPRLVPADGESVHDVIFVPARQQTWLFVHYLSELVPPYGIVVTALLPRRDSGLQPIAPILVRDGATKDRPEITDFTEELLRPAITALPPLADDEALEPDR